MLRKFSVQNYKNFRNRITLDFTNSRDYKYNEKCVKDGLLSKVLIMGCNASGKTNLGYAIFDIVCTLTDKIVEAHQTDKISFTNGFTNSPEAAFSYEFQDGERIIEYRYHKSDPYIITYECMKVNDSVVFEFDYHTGLKDVRGLKDYNAGTLDVNSVDGSLSVLKYIYRNTPQSQDSPIHFVMDFVSRMLYFRSAHDGNRFIGFFDRTDYIDQFIINNDLVKDFQRFLKEDAGIDMKLDVESNTFQKILVQKLKYKNIPFESNKSSGTHSLELYYYWSRRFDQVSFLFIDDFGMDHHYRLAKTMMLRTTESVDVQTVLTSHSTGLMTNDIMRPDSYLLLDDGRLRSLADSTDRLLREAHNLEKMFRNGEFD